MYIKRLAENLVQKALLLFEILSFEVYCRSDSVSPTIRGVGDSPYQRYAESATPRIVESGSRFSNTLYPRIAVGYYAKKNISGVAYYAKQF